MSGQVFGDVVSYGQRVGEGGGEATRALQAVLRGAVTMEGIAASEYTCACESTNVCMHTDCYTVPSVMCLSA